MASQLAIVVAKILCSVWPLIGKMSEKPHAHGKPPSRCWSGKLGLKREDYCPACKCRKKFGCVRRKKWHAFQQPSANIVSVSFCVVYFCLPIYLSFVRVNGKGNKRAFTPKRVTRPKQLFPSKRLGGCQCTVRHIPNGENIMATTNFLCTFGSCRQVKGSHQVSNE